MAYTVTTAGATLEFDTTIYVGGARPKAIDTNHFFIQYAGSGSDGYVEVLTVNTSTWAITTANARLEYDTTNGTFASNAQIDANHFIGFWSGSGSDGHTQVFEVNTTTWAVTTANAWLEFDTVIGQYHSAHKIDDNHFINFYSGNGSDGFAQVFEVNTTTWAVTTTGTRIEYDTQNSLHISAVQIDDNHFINFWLGGAATTDGTVQTFTVNTSTWAVTTANALLRFDTDVGSFNNAYAVDSNHFINFWTGADGDGFVQTFTVNTSTWAVTTASAQLEFDTQDHQTTTNTAVARIDTNHFLYLWAGPDTGASTLYDGFAQVFAVNTTTWAVTTDSDPFEYDTTLGEYPSLAEVIAGTTKYLFLSAGSGDDGYAQVLDVAAPNDSPTVALNSPADESSDSDTTPVLDFTGTDTESNDIRYNVQVATNSGMGSATTDTYTSTSTWTCPSGVTSVTVEAWGGGGQGGYTVAGGGAGGGGGGAYAKKVVSVTPFTTYDVVVGAGGTAGYYVSLGDYTDGEAGDDSYFGNTSTVLAKAGLGGESGTGAGGAGGSAASCVGDSKYSGGSGGDYYTSSSGGGGGAAGDGGAGGDGQDASAGGAGGAGYGDGGDGGNAGSAGSIPGGGGGGSTLSVGARGEVRVTYFTQPASRVSGQNTGNRANDTSVNVTMPNDVTAGNYVIVATVVYDDTATNNVVITKNSGGATIGTVVNDANYADGSYFRLSIDRVPITGSGSLVLTATSTGATVVVSSVNEYLGIIAKDGSAVTNTGTSTSPSSGNVSGHAGGLMVGAATIATGTVTHSNLSDALVYENTDNSTYQQLLTQDRLVSADETHAISHTNSSSATWYYAAVAYTGGSGPFIDKVSGTDAGFANPDNGGDTDPFNAGENIQYTVQSALDEGTYYWRVRGIDPSGSNTYGAWSSIRSFTVASGGVEEATHSPVTTTLSVVTPTTSYAEVATRSHSALSVTLAVVAPIASYVLVGANTPNPVGLTSTLVTPVSSYAAVYSNTPNPVSIGSTVVSPAASYVYVGTNTPNPVTTTLTPVAPVSSYIQINSNTPNPVVITSTITETTATAAVIGSNTPDPVSITSTANTATASYAAVYSNTPTPLSITSTATTQTASYIAEFSTVPNPVVITSSVTSQTSNYVQVGTNTPNPVVLTATVPTQASGYVSGSVAAPNPIQTTLTVVTPATSYVYVASNTPDPVSITLSQVTPSSSYVQIGTANHNPIQTSLSVTEPASSYVFVGAATHSPITLTTSVIDPESSYSGETGIYTANPLPISLTLTIPVVDRYGLVNEFPYEMIFLISERENECEFAIRISGDNYFKFKI